MTRSASIMTALSLCIRRQQAWMVCLALGNRRHVGATTALHKMVARLCGASISMLGVDSFRAVSLGLQAGRRCALVLWQLIMMDVRQRAWMLDFRQQVHTLGLWRRCVEVAGQCGASCSMLDVCFIHVHYFAIDGWCGDQSCTVSWQLFLMRTK